MALKNIHTDVPELHNFPAAGRRSASRSGLKQLLSGSNERRPERKERTIMERNQCNTTQGTRSKPSCMKVGNDSAEHPHHHTFDATTDELYNNSRSGLRGLLIFLTASAIALYCKEYSLADVIPANSMEQLGSTPPVILVNYVFGASTLSSLIIIAGRIYHDWKPGRTAAHLWFRVFFYLLYFISGALADNFNVVFISGLVVLGLQHYNVWNYYMRAIDINSDKCNSTSTYNS